MKKTFTRSQVTLAKKRDMETWIYSYADLITNLLALFVMMLIITNMDKSSRKDLAEGFKDYAASIASDSKAKSIAHNVKTKEDLRDALIKEMSVGGGPLERGLGQESLSSTNQSAGQNTTQGIGLGAGLAAGDGGAHVVIAHDGLRVTFEGSLVFESGSTALKPSALHSLDGLASILASLQTKYQVDVEGHTDSRPVTSAVFPSNWELSAARAGSVVRYLESKGLDSASLRAIGRGSSEPVSSDDTAASNRRVVIRIRLDES